MFLAIGSGGRTARPAENIEWCNIWMPEATRTDLPRVLLIGDSICNGYHDSRGEGSPGQSAWWLCWRLPPPWEIQS